MEKIKKAKKNSWVTIPEIIEMKARVLQNIPVSSIAKELGRDRQTIERSLTLFEQILPDAAGLKDKIIDRVDTIKEQMMQNAERLIMQADTQVARKVYDKETTAMDAAKISQIYASRLSAMAGFETGDGGGEAEIKSPKIVNFINTVINIISEQNDRPKSTSRIKEEDGGNDSGGKETIVEGVVS